MGSATVLSTICYLSFHGLFLRTNYNTGDHPNLILKPFDLESWRHYRFHFHAYQSHVDSCPLAARMIPSGQHQTEGYHVILATPIHLQNGSATESQALTDRRMCLFRHGSYLAMRTHSKDPEFLCSDGDDVILSRDWCWYFCEPFISTSGVLKNVKLKPADTPGGTPSGPGGPRGTPGGEPGSSHCSPNSRTGPSGGPPGPQGPRSPGGPVGQRGVPQGPGRPGGEPGPGPTDSVYQMQEYYYVIGNMSLRAVTFFDPARGSYLGKKLIYNGEGSRPGLVLP